MISVVEQEIKQTIKDTLPVILGNQNMLENQILVGLPDDVTKPFINVYSSYNNHKGVPIEIHDTFPQVPPKEAFILLQFEASQEDTQSGSIGNLQSNLMPMNEGNLIREKLVLQSDKSNHNFYLLTNNPISDVISIRQVSNFSVEQPNKIIIPYIPVLDDGKEHKFDVLYSPVNGADNSPSYSYGLNMIEKIAIDFISPNLSVLKCLYAIMVYLEAILKQTIQFNHNVYLPQIDIQGNDVIQELNGSNASLNQQLYYRRMNISYHTTQTFNVDALPSLKGITVEGDL